MEKKLSDYLHLYLGCECEHDCWTDAEDDMSGTKKGRKISELDIAIIGDYEWFNPKPILRPLSDMTEEELKEAKYIMIEYSNLRFKCDDKDTIKYTNVFIYDNVGEEGEHYSTSFSSPENLPAKIVPWMCKHGFDIFDLIRSGLAIDKTKLTK